MVGLMIARWYHGVRREPWRDSTWCGICFENISNTKQIRDICGHMFCTECLELYRKSRKTLRALPCPLCKHPLLSTERRYVFYITKPKLQPITQADIRKALLVYSFMFAGICLGDTLRYIDGKSCIIASIIRKLAS
jgi:hypothetical protein